MSQLKRGKCTWCGIERPDNELQGINILETGKKRYLNAVCKNWLECDSEEARDALKAVLEDKNGSIG